MKIGSKAAALKPFSVRLIHIFLIILFSVSIFSGYSAFDVDWSGVGIINRNSYYIAHLTSGISLLILIPLYVVVRLISLRGKWGEFGKSWRRPLSAIFKLAVIIGHIALVGLGLIIALAGWDGIMGANLNISPLGMFNWPAPYDAYRADEAIRLYKFHIVLQLPFYILIAIHVAAGLFHNFVLRDRLLVSMFSLKRLGSGQR